MDEGSQPSGQNPCVVYMDDDDTSSMLSTTQEFGSKEDLPNEDQEDEVQKEELEADEAEFELDWEKLVRLAMGILIGSLIYFGFVIWMCIFYLPSSKPVYLN